MCAPDLTGKVVVVTGAGSGIGRTTAALFHEASARVVVADADPGAALETVRGLDGGHAGARLVDVSDESSVQKFVKWTLEQFGRIDVLVNNAGVGDDMALPTGMSLKDWERTLAVNLTGPFLMSRAVLPGMVARRDGVIINMSSEAGLRGGAGGPAHTASEHGLIGLTKSIAYFHGEDGVRCNAICPGAVRADHDARVIPDRAGSSRMRATLALAGARVRPDRIAAMVLFLASGGASHVNGAVIPVDGGWSVR